MARAVNTQALARLVKNEIGKYTNLREAAQAAGVSPATLSRVQRGHAPDTDALISLARWLQIPMEKVLHDPPAVDDSTMKTSTPDKVEVHLRADPKLSPEAAHRLTQTFRALYEQFTDDEVRRAG